MSAPRPLESPRQPWIEARFSRANMSAYDLPAYFVHKADGQIVELAGVESVEITPIDGEGRGRLIVVPVEGASIEQVAAEATLVAQTVSGRPPRLTELTFTL